MELIAIDLDGTLLNSQHTISRQNLEAIQFARSKGVEVVIATGRAEFDVRTILAKTDLKTWVIGANGATIHEPDGKLFDSVAIDIEDAEEILRWLEDKRYYYEVFSDTAILTPQNGREIIQMEADRIASANPDTPVHELQQAIEKQFSQTGFSHVESYQDILDTKAPLYNILAFSFDQDKLADGWKRFEPCRNLTLVSSANHNFELEHKDASKGMALQKLTNYLGMSLDQTAAIGDSPNDLTMIMAAGYSAAMDNAKPSVITASDIVTKSNDEDGVAHAIYQWLK